MNLIERLAVVGSGASSIYLLKHLLDHASSFKGHLQEISIFERQDITGMGMPYNPKTTDHYNMSNISSEELPELPVTFGDWLRSQDSAVLEELRIEREAISDSEVYNRLALGQYLQAQYKRLIAELSASGMRIHEQPDCEVVDLEEHPGGGVVTLVTQTGIRLDFERVVIATGHSWGGEDRPAEGYYASPWPIYKLLPDTEQLHNFAIGTLGASLSAFDVISSLAHRHGEFVETADGMTFHPHSGTEQFKIVMHAANGLLPHLQFDQEEPLREIYRHVNRETLLALVDAQGFLRFETYFDKVCRPALCQAFAKDGMTEMVVRLAEPKFGISAFVEEMTEKHDYANAFEGMRKEMVEAKKSVENHQPIHWKEVVDDLMYTLNFHAGLMPAEDHLLLQGTFMPFLMNVIAAMPLPSANTLLALYDAGKLEIVSGKVTIAESEKSSRDGVTTVNVDNEGQKSTFHYRMFIDCSGQKPIEVEDYPFPALLKGGAVRKAGATFADASAIAAVVPEERQGRIFTDQGEPRYAIGGVDIDSAYRLIHHSGKPSARVYDIAFPHTAGLRPYSYGLQACSATSAIVVESWVQELSESNPAEPSEPATAQITKIYEKV